MILAAVSSESSASICVVFVFLSCLSLPDVLTDQPRNVALIRSYPQAHLQPPTKLNFRFARRTSNVRSHLELRSDRRETLGKRVSDDLQLSIFRRWKFVFRKKNLHFFSVFRDFRPILEEPGIFRHQNQLLHQILFQMHPSWGLYDQKSTYSYKNSSFFVARESEVKFRGGL